MTIFLYNGWMLSGISVGVVFTSLLILYFVYTLIGKIVTFSSRPARKGKAAAENDPDELTAAAIAMALDAETESGVHDYEPGIITIRHNRKYGQS